MNTFNELVAQFTVLVCNLFQVPLPAHGSPELIGYGVSLTIASLICAVKLQNWDLRFGTYGGLALIGGGLIISNLWFVGFLIIFAVFCLIELMINGKLSENGALNILMAIVILALAFAVLCLAGPVLDMFNPLFKALGGL